jgi:hypothetical protein
MPAEPARRAGRQNPWLGLLHGLAAERAPGVVAADFLRQGGAHDLVGEVVALLPFPSERQERGPRRVRPPADISFSRGHPPAIIEGDHTISMGQSYAFECGRNAGGASPPVNPNGIACRSVIDDENKKGTLKEHKDQWRSAMPGLVRDILSLVAMGGFLACASLWMAAL